MHVMAQLEKIVLVGHKIRTSLGNRERYDLANTVNKRRSGIKLIQRQQTVDDKRQCQYSEYTDRYNYDLLKRMLQGVNELARAAQHLFSVFGNRLIGDARNIIDRFLQRFFRLYPSVRPFL